MARKMKGGIATHKIQQQLDMDRSTLYRNYV